MLRTLAAVIVLAAILGFGVAHGLWSHRWNFSDEPQASAARLMNVPQTIGDWEGKDQEIPANIVAIAEFAGYVNRQYVNRRTGVGVSVLLGCGRPGPISVHPPEVCFVGQGFEFAAAPGKFSLASDGLPAPAEFFHSRLSKPNAPGSPPQRLLWAWTADGVWQAANDPRFAFAHHPALFKLYVQRAMTRADEPLAEDPIQGFLRAFLPEVQKAVFTSS